LSRPQRLAVGSPVASGLYREKRAPVVDLGLRRGHL
jgi:hypothetical protein